MVVSPEESSEPKGCLGHPTWVLLMFPVVLALTVGCRGLLPPFLRRSWSMAGLQRQVLAVRCWLLPHTPGLTIFSQGSFGALLPVPDTLNQQNLP